MLPGASICLHRRLMHLSTRSPKFPILPWTEFPARVSDSSNKIQIYTSLTDEPFLNLSIEHYLFQNTPPGSKVLFLYRNSNCIVIGRNQNPWLESNLNLVSGFTPTTTTTHGHEHLPPVPLIRRRSGGGTVFHDSGNINWSVICDLNDFTRDKHAEMVVRALRTLEVSRARVNERHDIVLDQGIEESEVDANDTHITPFTNASAKTAPLKVSGSAYKLARNRALHHGTALLQSPNLENIPLYLRSPLKPFISAKGVESVSSPIGNIGISPIEFQNAVCQQFNAMYGESLIARLALAGSSYGDPLAIPEIHNGVKEMKSNHWRFLQTPQFEISSQPFNSQDPARTSQKMSLNIKHGLIQSVDLGAARIEQASAGAKPLEGQELGLAKWDHLVHGQDLDEEVVILTGLIPIMSSPKTRARRGFRPLNLSSGNELS